MDAIRTAIMNNRFNAIVEEGSSVIFRTAHTTFVKLSQDYQCALATAEGDMFAHPMQSGVNVFVGSALRPMIDCIGMDNIHPGDVLISNDPFRTDGMVTHLMDITILYPIFEDDKLIAWGWSFVHCSDIGGAVPGSINPANTDIFQEGLRVRPTKIYERGVLNELVRDIYQDNSRIPNEMWGDLMAMMAGLKSMERRILELCDRYGTESVTDGMHDVINYAEMKARKVIESIPDGEYKFSDYLEGIHEGQIALFAVTMTVKGSEIEVDFTGTDPQMAAAYNLTTGSRTHPYIVQCLYAFILTRDPLTPRNVGILRPIKSWAPRGTVLNGEYPCSGGSRAASATRAFDLILGCLNQAFPEGVAAADSGQAGIIVVTGPDPRSGRDRVNVINTIMGGGGARRMVDGVDGTAVRYSQVAVPIELMEVETSLVIRGIENIPDTRSAGEYVGGAQTRIEIECLADRAIMTVRNMNRFVFAAWGVQGGETGRLGKVVVNPGKPNERSVGKISALEMECGDIVQLNSPSGGGFGDPLTRNIDAISQEIADGLLSKERAEEVYAVVYRRDGEIDTEATNKLREKVKASRGDLQLFHFCDERKRHDHVWPMEARTELSTLSMKNEKRVRSKLVGAVHNRMLAEGQPVDKNRIEKLLDEEMQRLSGGLVSAS
tara:strand:+ start:8345 stop:10330 length:1986 start_codon:yes stop_codon:yes gene_type:complete